MKHRRFLAIVIAAIMLVTAIPVMAEEHIFTIEDGVLTSYRGPGGDVVIPDGVTRIDINVFINCDSVESIEIPDSLTSVSAMYLPSGPSFKEIKVKDTHESLTSVNGVLFDKEMKKLICYPDGKSGSLYIIPNTVERIAGYAFAGCENIRELKLPNNLSNIDKYGMPCINLEILHIPKTLTCLDLEDLQYCTNLSRFKVADGHPVYVAENGILYSTDMKELMCYPIGAAVGSVTVRDGVESIGYSAFRYCKQMTEVILPEGLTAIKGKAFSNCARLASVKLPDSLKSIYSSAFEYCRALGSIYIPDGIRSISDHAFNETSIKEFIIPEGIAHIDSTAFGISKSTCVFVVPKSIDANIEYTVIPNRYPKVYCYEGSGVDLYCRKFNHPVIHMPESEIVGDTDGNGVVNLADVSEIMKYYSTWNNSLNLYAADVDNDGKVALTDVTLILKYIAGWNVLLK